MTLQLHQRAGGGLLGVVLGGTSFGTVTRGTVSGSAVELGIELKDPALTRSFALSGTLKGSRITAVTDDGLGAGAQTVVLDRTREVLQERRFGFVPDRDDGDLVEVAIVQDLAGGFVSGRYVGTRDCALFACSGGVTSFAEDSLTGRITVGLETGGACPGEGSFTADFDPATRLYRGTFTFSSCVGTDAGALTGGRATATRTDDAASVLATYGRLADDLEARTSFVAPHPSFSPTYLHYGASLADRLAELNAQVAAHDALRIELSRFRSVTTVIPPGVHPYLDALPGAIFHDRRTGLSGGVATLIRDVDTDAFNDELSILTREAGAWVIGGNRDPDPRGLDMPVRAADLAHAAYGIGPYGIHGGGHPEGHPGIDFELVGGADVVAMRGGVISAIQDGTTFPGQKIVTLDTGMFEVRYDHLEAGTLPPSIVVGAAVARGDVVGHPARPCCEDALCGSAGCCSARWPRSPLCGPSTFFMIHLGVRGSDGELCPADAMTAAAQAELVGAFRGVSYRGQLTEPFLCGDPDRNDDVFPLVTRWDRSTSVAPGAPSRVRFSRSAPDAGETYEWLDAAGVVFASGTVSIAGHGAIAFWQTWPTYATYWGRLAVEGDVRSATLLLDVGPPGGTPPPDLSGADLYTAVLEQ